MTTKIILVAVLLGVLAGAALFLSAARVEATACPSDDPTQCPVYGDSRDAWLPDRAPFGFGQGDSFTWSTSSTGVPFVNEVACNNNGDDDNDAKIDFDPPVGHARDPGCSSPSDDSEEDGPPAPPPPPWPPPPPPPPGAPPPPPGCPPECAPPRTRTDTFTVGGGGQSPNTVACTATTWIDWDVQRLPTIALFFQELLRCEPPASLNIFICAERRLAILGNLFYPVTCEGAFAINNVRLSARIQRRCRTTQSKFQWQTEAIIRVTDSEGHIVRGYYPTGPDWPSIAGFECR